MNMGQILNIYGAVVVWIWKEICVGLQMVKNNKNEIYFCPSESTIHVNCEDQEINAIEGSNVRLFWELNKIQNWLAKCKVP
jgi:hypothetical protein